MNEDVAIMPRIMLVAGEPSGDALGGEIMQALTDMTGGKLSFCGVGGARMEEQGLASIFPMTDISVMGPREIVPRLPLILRRIRQTAKFAIAHKPDVMVIIDSPEFTHLVARWVARKAPEIPIVNYVSPSVWAWRRGRARAMARYLRRVLALLPFEPAFFKAQAGLDCIYVGHPAINRLPEPGAGKRFREAHDIPAEAPLLLLLPGSRINEVKRLMGIFGETAARLTKEMPGLHIVLPTVPHVGDYVRAEAEKWKLPVIVIQNESEKRAAFGAATAALAASGTVSLELGLARVPMVIGYRIERVAGTLVGRMLKVPSVVLVNLILDRPSVKELLQYRCTAENLSAALLPLLKDTPERRRALADLDELKERMEAEGEHPSVRAARAVLELLDRKLLPSG